MANPFAAMRETLARAIVQADEQNGGPSWEAMAFLGKHLVSAAYDRADAVIASLDTPARKLATTEHAYRNLVAAAVAFEQHMDQWQKAAIRLPGGRTLYLSLTLEDPYPLSFDPVDASGTPLPQYGPIWTEEEVARLNAHQANPQIHPYTCPGDLPACANQRNLVATANGWVCQCGQYTQQWAHGVGGRS